MAYRRLWIGKFGLENVNLKLHYSKLLHWSVYIEIEIEIKSASTHSSFWFAILTIDNKSVVHLLQQLDIDVCTTYMYLDISDWLLYKLKPKQKKYQPNHQRFLDIVVVVLRENIEHKIKKATKHLYIWLKQKSLYIIHEDKIKHFLKLSIIGSLPNQQI